MVLSRVALCVSTFLRPKIIVDVDANGRGQIDRSTLTVDLPTNLAAVVFLDLAISCNPAQNSVSSETLVFRPLMNIERLMTAVFMNTRPCYSHLSVHEHYR